MSITPQQALQRCIEHRELFHDEMTAMMRLIMSGEMPPTLVAGLLVADADVLEVRLQQVVLVGADVGLHLELGGHAHRLPRLLRLLLHGRPADTLALPYHRGT